MAMSLTDSANLINDMTFRGRVKVAALHFAQYLQAQPDLSTSQSTWIQRVMTQPDQMSLQLVPGVVMQDLVQNAGGAGVTDTDLQTATEIVAKRQM